MGLDASVYCNCFETGRLRSPPRADFNVYVSESGSLECRNSDLDILIAFDSWRYNEACAHEDTKLLHQRIGNFLIVGLMRGELIKQADDFPIILTKVLYSGSHSGDFLTFDQVRELQHELPPLRTFRCRNAEFQHYIDRFCIQMSELIECSLSVNKPIVF